MHDARAGRPGLFVEALDGVKAAKNAGFFVVVTTTIYPDTDVKDVADAIPDVACDARGWIYVFAVLSRRESMPERQRGIPREDAPEISRSQRACWATTM